MCATYKASILEVCKSAEYVFTPVISPNPYENFIKIL